MSFHCWLYTNLRSALHLTWSFIESGHLLTELGSNSSLILTSSGILRQLCVKEPRILPFNAPRLPLSHCCGAETAAPPESLLLLKLGPVPSNATGGPTARNSSSDWQTLGGVLFAQTLAQHLLTILRSVCWVWHQWKSGHCDKLRYFLLPQTSCFCPRPHSASALLFASLHQTCHDEARTPLCS